MSIDVTFYGVWGSTALSCARSPHFGGNTSCIVIESPDTKPIILDLGTGAVQYAMSRRNTIQDVTVLLTHMHFDHICGLPFFIPTLPAATSITIYGPPTGSRSLRETLNQLVTPPFFPVGIDDFAPEVSFIDLLESTVELDTPTAAETDTESASTKSGERLKRAPGVSVMSRAVRHSCLTNGYRIDIGDTSIAYIPDHQQPLDGSMDVDDNVLALADGVDLLIHDGQYPADVFEQRKDWGHSTPDYAHHVAQICGAKRLSIHSHDPAHSDDDLFAIEKHVSALAQGTELEVFCGRDNLSIQL